MPKSRRKLSVDHLEGERRIARSRTAKREKVPNHCTSSGGAPKISLDLPQLCNNQVQRMSRANAMQQTERTINLSQHRVTVGGVRGRPTVTHGPSRNPLQSFAQFFQLEEADTEVISSNEKECATERYNINVVPKNLDKISTSTITTPSKQKDETFKASLLSGDLKPLN